MIIINKKYQVFISSTYRDLKEERLAVTQMLLKMGFIPVGMEQFPASDMSQMDYIKMMLDTCDYYILILAGKYGTVDSDGIGFTEKEYDYAIANQIPVMSIIAKDIGKLESAKCEESEEGKSKLQKFRNKVCEGKLVDHYTDIGSLTSAVAAALYSCVQNYPAKGWIRGNISDNTTDIESQIEKYMQEHTVTKDDIDALFESKSFSPDCQKCTDISNELTYKTLSVDGARTLVEEFAKNLPKLEWEEI